MMCAEMGVLSNSYGATRERRVMCGIHRGAMGGVNLFCLPSGFSELMRIHQDPRGIFLQVSNCG